jgi:hypothetical protein
MQPKSIKRWRGKRKGEEGERKGEERKGERERGPERRRKEVPFGGGATSGPISVGRGRFTQP